MNAVYRNCMVCGKEFKICNTCINKSAEQFQWKRVVCCREHFAYHMPIIQYTRNIIDKYEAKEELDHAFSEYGDVNFVESVRDIVNEIYDGKYNSSIVINDNVNDDTVANDSANDIVDNNVENIVNEIIENNIEDVDFEILNHITNEEKSYEQKTSDTYKKKNKK